MVAKLFVFSYTTGKLEAMLLEAKGSWAQAEKAYSSLLEDSPLDQVSSEQILPSGINVIYEDLLFCCVTSVSNM